MASLLYGAGLRLLECATLRVKDIDLAAGRLIVRRGKGSKDRATLLPQSLVAPMKTHLSQVKAQHQTDLVEGAGTSFKAACRAEETATRGSSAATVHLP